jgi:DNA-binding LacI/PurR family transcriptional regulator
LLEGRCEAAILVGALVTHRALGSLATRLPVVVVGQPARNADVDVVRVADNVGMRLAVDHLVEGGHRSIVHVDGGRAPAAAERRNGYKAAMRRHDLADQLRVIPAGESEEDGAAAARLLAEEGVPDAVLTYNDRSAVGLLDVFVRSGISVPNDISVVGFDDSQVARLPYLQLTTVSQDAARLATLAVERAVARIEQDPIDGRQIVLSPDLIVRGTTSRRDLVSGANQSTAAS